MQRLINAFRKLPSPSNRKRIDAYLAKHPMASCLLMPADQAFLKAHGFPV